MKRNVLLELLEDGNMVSLYSPRFEGEAFTEFEKFLLLYKDVYPNDVKQLVYRLDIKSGKVLMIDISGMKDPSGIGSWLYPLIWKQHHCVCTFSTYSHDY